MRLLTNMDWSKLLGEGQTPRMFYVLVGTSMFFAIALACVIITTMVLMLKFRAYLHARHYDKWRELTSIGKSGPGYFNTIRMMRFVFNQEDLGDPAVMDFKVKLKHCYIYVAVGLGATSVMPFLLLVMLFLVEFASSGQGG